MFASNNRISGRQAMRLLTFDLLGYSALVIPAALAKEAGQDGIFSLVLGILAGFVYLLLLKGILAQLPGSYSEYLTSVCGKFVGSILKIGYIIYFLLLAGHVAAIFAELVVKELLQEQFELILGIILLLTFYGVVGGIEGRARVYEILFWIILLPLLVMMVSTIPTVDGDYWRPIFAATKTGVLRGAYQTFFGCSILALLPFLAEYVKKRETLYRCGKWALFLTGGILCFLYMILLGMFGSAALATTEYPAVTMMSRVQITGGFFKRVDSIMFGIWFFTLYALLNSLVFFGGRLWMNFVQPVAEIVSKKLTEEEMSSVNDTNSQKGVSKPDMEKLAARFSMLLETILVFVLANSFYQSQAAEEAYEKFFWYVGTPFVVLVPLLLWFVQRMKKSGLRNKTFVGVLIGGILLGSSFLSGCAATEIEDREFPVLLAVKDEENFVKEWLNDLQQGNKKIDYNHLKIVLISRDFLENEAAMAEMISILKQDKNVPLNAYVVTTDNVEELVAAGESLDIPLGNYLEELLENSEGIKKETYPTIGMLYQEKENRMETLFIPYLSLVEEKPEITAYEVYKRGVAEGIVETDAALLAFFIANQMEEYVLQLGVNNFVRLSDTKNEIAFEEHIKESGLIQKHVIVTIACEGEIIQEKISGDEAEAKKWLNTQILEYMTAQATEALERGIDLTNSKKKLGGAMRSWYERYLDAPENYEKDIDIVFELKVRWVE